MQRKRKLCLTIYDYNNNVVCDLYDNKSDVSGQATDVYIDKERNGWKELSFTIPSTCIGEDGLEENYRLNYLIAEYQIKAVDDKKTDWYVISEPNITRNNFSKNVSVKAGHVSQLLKHKNLDLEFSDDEGNNVGTAEALLTTVLEGSSWNVGYVENFLDDNGEVKVRSITGPSGTGALGFIEKICDVFEAKPIYHGDTKTVDLISMNPLRDIDPRQIPAKVRDEFNVLELHYDRNIHSLNKTINTNSMATRLYAYGSSGDMNGACTLQNAKHFEWQFTAPETGDEYSMNLEGIDNFFQGNVDVGDVLIWSNMDITSMTYIWNQTKSEAYELYDKPKGQYVQLVQQDVYQTENNFAYLLGLKYYRDVGLMSDETFQQVARFQKEMPEYYKIVKEKSESYIKGESDLSAIAEHNTGLLKLKISSVDVETESGIPSEAWPQKFTIDIDEGDHGVLYRTDYDKAERRFFQWHVTSQLKANGDPVTGTPSVLLFIHNTDPITWDMVYLKRIYDSNGELVVNSEGKPGDFTYTTGDFPTAVTVWGNNVKFQTSDRVYLLCTNSMTGLLGGRLNGIEALIENLYATTRKHPTTFFDLDNPTLVLPSPLNNEYEWLYKYHHDMRDGELWFCWAAKGESIWYRAYYEDTFPLGVEGDYYYDQKRKWLWRFTNGDWTKYESVPDQSVADMFSKVIYLCKRRDMLYKGLYKYYQYNGYVPVGNYAFSDGYGSFWTFKTKKDTNIKLLLNTVLGYVFQDDSDEVVSFSTVESDTVFYPLENELEGKTFYNGSIDPSNGVEQDVPNRFRTGTIRVWEDTRYNYDLPDGTFVHYYDVNLRYLGVNGLSGEGSFVTMPQTRYIRFTTNVQQPGGYVHIENYDNVFYINEEQYSILAPVYTDLANVPEDQELIGIDPLMKKFADLADKTYEEDLTALRNAQTHIKEQENLLSDSLGDMLKDGRWQDANYIYGDEQRLYKDAMTMFKQISEPEVSYSFTFLDLFGTHQEEYYETHDAEWPDVDIVDICHLVDQESKTNCWAYIEKLHKCYDQEWKTTLDIDTKLTIASKHNFSDVLGRIAEVAKDIRAKQSIYEQSFTRPVDSSRLQGIIDINQNMLNGGSSNWHTDEKGNIIFEAADGLSAMVLGGRGMGVANSRNADGSWEWRTAATGYGLTADEINTGKLSADLIEVGSITADKLMSNVGQELEIGSNKALQLFATTNGSRPAGSLLTTDSKIEIKAGYEEDGTTVPAEINIASGGELNLEGGNVNISSGGTLNLQSTGAFYLRAKGADNINSTADGIYIGTDGMNLGGGKFKVAFSGDTSTVNITAAYFAVGDSARKVAEFSVDSNNGVINILADNLINIAAGNTLTLVSNGGGVVIGNIGQTFTIDSDTVNAYIYNRISSLNPTNASDELVPFGSLVPGIYVGTDGINIANMVKLGADGNAKFTGEVNANSGLIGGIHIGTAGIYSGNKSSAAAESNGFYIDSLGAIYIGPHDQTGYCPFQVTNDGSLRAVKGNIAGWYIRSDYLGNAETKDDSTIGIANATGSNIVFWAGGNYNSNPDAPKFIVQANGTLISTLGNIGGWYIGDSYIGNNSSKEVSTVGMAFYPITADDSSVVFWAGGAFSSTPYFRVTKGGILYAVGAVISGDAHFSGTIDAGAVVSCNISADRITSGAMSADRIYGGTLTLGGENGKFGRLVIKDSHNEDIGYWDRSGITALAGTISGPAISACEISGSTISGSTISGGSIVGSSIDIGDGNFTVNSLGHVTMKKLVIDNVPVDVSDFDKAVAYGSGAWDGTTFNATFNFFKGKITRTVGISSSVDVTYISSLMPWAEGGYEGYALGTVGLDLYVSGVKRSEAIERVMFDASKLYSAAWDQAREAVSYEPGAKTIYVPRKGGFKGQDVESYDITATWTAGEQRVSAVSATFFGLPTDPTLSVLLSNSKTTANVPMNGFSDVKNAIWQDGYDAGAEDAGSYNDGWNDCLAACTSHTYYTGTWYDKLYVAPAITARAVNNCIGEVTSVTAYTLPPAKS